ncbi:M23 family metallopeptidase [Pseudonocardia acidicola]|uniref:M23 family metallopeptidase n=1 Tax=Pseudonocardia acidicola TaxID=2724939 RepID=A0ABX1S2P4_9PSEU|nr:M23 family metallopeptidase [Pseudonocardia acidicola]NMH95830.1 M23 family metallopeptidase [Pseudonocardia acidicola]
MAAGAGGTHRSAALAANLLPGPLRTRVLATVVAGGAVAAGGHAAFPAALPAIADSANVFSLGSAQHTDAPSGAAPAAPGAVDGTVNGADMAQLAAAPAPAAGTAAALLTTLDLHQQAADVAGKAADAAKAVQAAKVAEAATVAQAATAQPAAVTGAVGRAVQMVVGQVSSGFGMRGGVLHAGVDIAAPIGTPIHVPLGGTVISSGPASGFGLWVRVQHADGTVTVYGHINRSLVNVGEKVNAGQVIAEVGNRGQSTGPHLHFEVITPGGQKINPQPWLAARGIGV